MNLRRIRALFGALPVLCCAFLSAGEVDLKAPLPSDPRIKMGALPNGMRYWIRQHNRPPGKIGLWLHVGSGSVNETDTQRGLAHFLEHMAFNGSKHFPPGTLVKYFESLGMRFGADQNAFTGFDQTTYILGLPDVKEETIGKGLRYLSDVAYRLSLLPEEIGKERGVVLEEARARKGPRQRLLEKLLPILLPKSRVAKRLPIGQAEIIKKAARSDFLDYYGKWYRPDQTTLLAVGDLDPKIVEKLITKHFRDWKPVKNAPQNFDPGIRPYGTTRAAVLSDPELTETDVSALSVQPMKRVRTAGDFRERLVRDFGTWIFNRRLDELRQKGSAPYQRASVSISPFLNVCTYLNASASGQPGRWRAMLKVLLTELKRARTHGFLPRELSDAKKATRAAAQRAARTESTRGARAFLGRMNSAVAQKRKPLSAAQRLALLEKLLPTITLKEVAAAFAKNFAPKNRLLLVEMPEKKGLSVPDQAALLELARKAEAAPVQAKAAKARPEALLARAPLPGRIKKRETDAGLGIVSVTLENGVRVHARKMDFKKDSVWVRLTLPGGEIRETPATRGLTQAAALVFRQQASKRLSSTDIRNLMTGKNVSVSGGVRRDQLALRLNGTPKDLEWGFQLLHLLLTEGKIEASAWKVWKEEQGQAIERRKSSVEAQMREAWRALLYANDPRVKSLSAGQLKQLTREAAQAWLEGILRNAPVEAAIVGDIETDRALALAQKYLGSLKKRKRKDGSLKKRRKLKHEKGPRKADVEVETITPRAVVLLGWRGAEAKDVKEARGLRLAAQILSGRLREEIREKRSLTYSTGCFSVAGEFYRDSGFLAAYLTTDPAKAAEAARLTRQVMERFAAEGPTAKELATAHKQFRVKIEQARKQPAYWAGVLGSLDYRGRKLKDVKGQLEAMSNYPRKDLMKVLKKYIRRERYLQVITRPKPKAAGKAP